MKKEGDISKWKWGEGEKSTQTDFHEHMLWDWFRSTQVAPRTQSLYQHRALDIGCIG